MVAWPEGDRLHRMRYPAHRPPNSHFVHLDTAAVGNIAEPQRHSRRTRPGRSWPGAPAPRVGTQSSATVSSSITAGQMPIECRIVEPGAGQFWSTARIRLLPTTHCEYVHPSASTSHTRWRDAATSLVTLTRVAYPPRGIRRMAGPAVPAAHRSPRRGAPPDVVVAALNTLAVRARTGASAAVLDALIDATVGVICARPD